MNKAGEAELYLWGYFMLILLISQFLKIKCEFRNCLNDFLLKNSSSKSFFKKFHRGQSQFLLSKCNDTPGVWGHQEGAGGCSDTFLPVTFPSCFPWALKMGSGCFVSQDCGSWNPHWLNQIILWDQHQVISEESSSLLESLLFWISIFLRNMYF